MNFALVTAHNDAYQPLADITWNQNKLLYAQKWGYDAFAKTDNFKHPASQMSFERTELIIELLKTNQYDWIHAAGCDTMITNFNIKYEDLVDNNYDFVIATDCHNINNDSFFARNTPRTIAWLQHVVDVREQYANNAWYDQQAMIDSIDMMGDGIKIVPQRMINSYDYSQYPLADPQFRNGHDMLGNDGKWQPGDFLIHWPGIPNTTRLVLAQQKLTQVIQ
jgi:hypothetical protein